MLFFFCMEVVDVATNFDQTTKEHDLTRCPSCFCFSTPRMDQATWTFSWNFTTRTHQEPLSGNTWTKSTLVRTRYRSLHSQCKWRCKRDALTTIRAKVLTSEVPFSDFKLDSREPSGQRTHVQREWIWRRLPANCSSYLARYFTYCAPSLGSGLKLFDWY